MAVSIPAGFTFAEYSTLTAVISRSLPHVEVHGTLREIDSLLSLGMARTVRREAPRATEYGLEVFRSIALSLLNVQLDPAPLARVAFGDGLRSVNEFFALVDAHRVEEGDLPSANAADDFDQEAVVRLEKLGLVVHLSGQVNTDASVTAKIRPTASGLAALSAFTPDATLYADDAIAVLAALEAPQVSLSRLALLALLFAREEGAVPRHRQTHLLLGQQKPPKGQEAPQNFRALNAMRALGFVARLDDSDRKELTLPYKTTALGRAVLDHAMSRLGRELRARPVGVRMVNGNRSTLRSLLILRSLEKRSTSTDVITAVSNLEGSAVVHQLNMFARSGWVRRVSTDLTPGLESAGPTRFMITKQGRDALSDMRAVLFPSLKLARQVLYEARATEVSELSI